MSALRRWYTSETLSEQYWGKSRPYISYEDSTEFL
jgi:hypothetical protein